MTVMIGVDPHKRSHTTVAIDGDDVELAAIEVRASVRQVDELLGWAEKRSTNGSSPTPTRSGSGRASGDDSTSQRDRPHTPTAGASEQPLPDPHRA